MAAKAVQVAVATVLVPLGAEAAMGVDTRAMAVGTAAMP